MGTDGDNHDGPPPDGPEKTRGEQLADKLAGSNPVEPKQAVGEATPPAGPKPSDVAVAATPPAAAQPVKPAAAPAKPAEPVKPAAPATPAAPVKPVAAAKPAPAKPAAGKPAPAAPAKAPAEDDGPPAAPPWYRTLRADPPAHVRLALGALLMAIVFVLWWLATRGSATEAFISPSRLPSPGAVFGDTERLLDRDLMPSIIDTLQRVFLGIILAASVGVTMGVLAGAHRGISATIAPLVIFLRSVPMGALLPLSLLLFSTGEKQKYMFIFLAVVPFVFSDAMKAIASVPDRYIETAQTLGASKRQIITKVLVPLALPDIVTSLRFQFGLALGYITLAEAGNILPDHGLGKMIAVSERTAKLGATQVFLLLFVIALIAFFLDLLLRTLQRGVFPWRKDL